MAGFVKRLLSGKQLPTFDLERAVGHALLQLPCCPNTLVVAGPEYDDANYTGDVFVEADGLLSWAEHHAETTSISSNDLQTALNVLPIWLRSADMSNDQPIVVDQAMADMLRPYILDFVNMDIVSMYCRKCGMAYKDFKMEKLNERNANPWYFWTDEWRCPSAHMLYREDHRVHFYKPSP